MMNLIHYTGQAVTIYPKYLEVENIRQNVIFKVLKEAVTKSGNKPANDVYFGLYNAQSIYASADEAWIVMPRSNFIIRKGETATLDIGLSSLIADEQITVSVYRLHPCGSRPHSHPHRFQFGKLPHRRKVLRQQEVAVDHA